MEIGRLKHRIKIYEMKKVINEEGGIVERPTTIATPYCEVTKTTIKEFKTLDMDARKETINFIIRYQQQSPIHSGQYVSFKGKVYKIKNIEIDFQDMERQLLKCEVTD